MAEDSREVQCYVSCDRSVSTRKYTSVREYNMGVLCFARGAFAYVSCLGVYTRKYTGRCMCVIFQSAVSAPAGIRAERYSQHTSHRGHDAGQFVCHYLPHRTLVKIQGQDTSPFLQGLITNDMGVLQEPGLGAMYSHMLNVQGRTLYDMILYRYSICRLECSLLCLLGIMRV